MRSGIRKSIAAVLCVCLLLTLLPATALAATTNKSTSTKVNIKCVYNGGNSQVYANKATGAGAASGWNIQYIYSSNIINSNAVFANLKGALNSPYSGMVPSVANENATVGLSVSTYGTPDENWKSAEWVARNIIPGSTASVANGSSGAVNATNIKAIQTTNQRFAAEEASQEAAHKAAWEKAEKEAEKAFEKFQDEIEEDWDAAELEKQKKSPEYSPIPYERETYKGSTYKPLDFSKAKIEGAKTLADNQFETAVGSAMSGPFYTIENNVIIESYNVAMIMHVTTVYSQSSEKTTATASVQLPVSTIESAADTNYILRPNLSAVFASDTPVTAGTINVNNGDGLKIDYYYPMVSPTNLDAGYSKLAEYHIQIPLTGCAESKLTGTITVPLPAGYEGASAKIIGGAGASGSTAATVSFPVTLDVSNDVASVWGIRIEYKAAHTHSYSAAWQYDALSHYHACSCGEKSDIAAHVFDSDTDASCNVCGYTRKVAENKTNVNTTDSQSSADISLGTIRTLEPSASTAGGNLKKALKNKDVRIYSAGNRLTVKNKDGSGEYSIAESFDWNYLRSAGVELLCFEFKNVTIELSVDSAAPGKAVQILISSDKGVITVSAPENASFNIRLRLKNDPGKKRLVRLQNGESVAIEDQSAKKSGGAYSLVATGQRAGSFRLSAAK